MAFSYDLAQQRIPADGTFDIETVDGESVLKANFSENQEILEDTIFQKK
jgi:hypothetical protein